MVEKQQHVGELKELLGICREYLTALRIELARQKATDPKRQMELAAYFTHCNLQPGHSILALKLAYTAAFKRNLFASASGNCNSFMQACKFAAADGRLVMISSFVPTTCCAKSSTWIDRHTF